MAFPGGHELPCQQRPEGEPAGGDEECPGLGGGQAAGDQVRIAETPLKRRLQIKVKVERINVCWLLTGRGCRRRREPQTSSGKCSGVF